MSLRHTRRLLGLLGLGLLPLGCVEGISGPETKLPPDTGIPVEAILRDSLTSQITLSWYGTPRTGLIAGYAVSVNDSSWMFTSQASLNFRLPLRSAAQTFHLRVSAIDNQGNGVYDPTYTWGDATTNAVYSLPGGEPYTDSNNNGQYDTGEPFTDLGVADPTPATLDVPVVNSAPSAGFDPLTVLPDSTLPVLTFTIVADDPDGVNTLTSVEVALNSTDPSAFVTLPGSARTITLVAQNPRTAGATTTATVTVLGSTKTYTLSGLRLDANNTINVRVRDLAGTPSPVVRYPSDGTLYFRRPSGDLLIVDDSFIAPNTETAYLRARLAAVGLPRVDVLDLRDDRNKAFVRYPSTMLKNVLSLYKAIIWSSDQNFKTRASTGATSFNNFELTTALLPAYLASGGRALVSADFSAVTTDIASPLLGYAPIDSLYATAGRVTLNSVISSKQAGYPDLRNGRFLSGARGFRPVTNATTLYTAPLTFTGPPRTVQAPVGAKNDAGTLVFLTLALQDLGGYGVTDATRAAANNAALEGFLRQLLTDFTVL